MAWLDYLAYFAGGMFLANAVPHFVHGVSGKPFQSPFARPRGVGLSSSVVNMAWALANLVIVWLLLARVGSFDIRDLGDGTYRRRVGAYRIRFEPDWSTRIVSVLWVRRRTSTTY